jgi:caspase domain-containing protein
MRRDALLAFLAVLFLDIVAGPAFADKRVALVIGNGAYQRAPLLPNPRNDAQDVAASLKRSGFETIVGIDLDKSGMEQATIEFARAARTADVAIFYYSGHAMQYAGVNYLIPVDAELTDEADLRRMTRVDEIVADLQQAKTLRILVLDSCRDNPLVERLKRSIGKTRAVSLQGGLAKIDSPEGMIISYATQSGRTANDGTGRNSPYTAAFLSHIEEPEEIGTIFRRISADVYAATQHEQLPELSLSLIGEFYLRGRLDITVRTELPTSDPCAAAGGHWKSAETIGTIAAFEDHVARFPNCTFAGLAKSKIAVLAAPPAPLPAGDVRRFDGLWTATIVCERKGDVLAWSNVFIASVKNGVLHGQTGTDGRPGGITYDGTIKPNGSTEIIAKGLTGADTKFTLNHAPPSTKFSWNAAGRFEGSHGSAIRVEGRTCNMEFAKR